MRGAAADTRKHDKEAGRLCNQWVPETLCIDSNADVAFKMDLHLL